MSSKRPLSSLLLQNFFDLHRAAASARTLAQRPRPTTATLTALSAILSRLPVCFFLLRFGSTQRHFYRDQGDVRLSSSGCPSISLSQNSRIYKIFGHAGVQRTGRRLGRRPCSSSIKSNHRFSALGMGEARVHRIAERVSEKIEAHEGEKDKQAGQENLQRRDEDVG